MAEHRVDYHESLADESGKPVRKLSATCGSCAMELEVVVPTDDVRDQIFEQLKVSGRHHTNEYGDK